MSHDPEWLVPGGFVAVVGPSGAGKDTLIRYASERLADDPAIHFARRYVTRAADGETEDHIALDEMDFEHRRMAGGFSLCWQAHGLSYGLGAELVGKVRDGGLVVANLSRRTIAETLRTFPRLVIVEVCAPKAVLVERLLSRGRENRERVMERVARDAPVPPLGGIDRHVRVDNSGEVSIAGDAMVALLRALRDPSGAHADKSRI